MCSSWSVLYRTVTTTLIARIERALINFSNSNSEGGGEPADTWPGLWAEDGTGTMAYQFHNKVAIDDQSEYIARPPISW